MSGFAENINYIAKLDHTYGTTVELAKAGLVTVDRLIVTVNVLDTTTAENMVVTADISTEFNTILDKANEVKRILQLAGMTVAVTVNTTMFSEVKFTITAKADTLLHDATMTITSGTLDIPRVYGAITNTFKALPILASMNSDIVESVIKVAPHVDVIETVAANIEDVQNAEENAIAAINAKNAAEISASKASVSAAAAAASEAVVLASQAVVLASEAVVIAKEAGAVSSAASALASKNAAAVSEANAADSETNAKVSEDNAKVSELNATTSETNAVNAASAASISETNASASETNASAHASSATMSASAAALSETNAAISATSALNSETNAANSASEAAMSATSAYNSATSAATSEVNAGTSEANAAQALGEAIANANNAAASAVISSNAASSALISESNAASSAASALQYLVDIEAIYDQFDDRYLGAKASDPSTDNDGLPILTGAMYWDTSTMSLKVYNGGSWIPVVESGGGLLAYQNLADVPDKVAARTNLAVYSKAESDAKYESADSTILKNADIGVTVQAYSVSTVIDSEYVHTDNNYTTVEKNKLASIAVGAEVNVNADWNAVSGDAQILNKPTTISGYGITDAYTKEEVDDAISSVSVTTEEKNTWNNKSDFSGSYNDLTDKPTYKTINNESILGEGNIDIVGGDGVALPSFANNNGKYLTISQDGHLQWTDMQFNYSHKQASMGFMNVYPAAGTFAPFCTNFDANSTISASQKIDDYTFKLRAGKKYKINGGTYAESKTSGVIILDARVYSDASGTTLMAPALSGQVTSYLSASTTNPRLYYINVFYNPTEDCYLKIYVRDRTLSGATYLEFNITIDEIDDDDIVSDTTNLANKNGDQNETFKVANAINEYDAINKAQLDSAISSLQSEQSGGSTSLSGGILQVVHEETISQMSFTGTTEQDVISCSITPKANGSKFLVMVNAIVGAGDWNATEPNFFIKRDGVVFGSAIATTYTAEGSFLGFDTGLSGSSYYNQISRNAISSGSVEGVPIQFKLCINSRKNSTVHINRCASSASYGSGVTSITVFEIKG